MDQPGRHDSLWAKLASRLRRKRDGQMDGGDDLRRAGQGEPDKDAAFEKMVSITYRSGQA